MPYKCVVCAKQVPDTKRITGQAMNPDGTVNRANLPAIFNPEDLCALEQALQIKDAHGGSVTIVTMGLPAASEILRESLYRGADRAAMASPMIPTMVGRASKEIKYVVFITKENHTYDGIFGTVPGGDGEPRYSEYGDQGWISEKSRTEHLPIMPNHVNLARKFAISDNFYMEPGFSGDGHPRRETQH